MCVYLCVCALLPFAVVAARREQQQQQRQCGALARKKSKEEEEEVAEVMFEIDRGDVSCTSMR